MTAENLRQWHHYCKEVVITGNYDYLILRVVTYTGSATALRRTRRFFRTRKPATPKAARSDETALMTRIVVMVRCLP